MILGIDLGQKTTGVAISHGQLATPLTTLKHQNTKEAVEKIAKICDQEGIDQVVIGFVEGKIKSLFTEFAQNLKKERPKLDLILWDETLTTRQAIQTMIKLQVPKRKRHQKEHEFSAALILQSFLESR